MVACSCFKNCFNHETLNWTRISFRLEKAKLLTLKLKIKVLLTERIFLFYLVFFSINFVNWYSSLAINFFSWWLTHCTLSLLEWTRSTKFADRLTHVMSCHVFSASLQSTFTWISSPCSVSTEWLYNHFTWKVLLQCQSMNATLNSEQLGPGCLQMLPFHAFWLQKFPGMHIPDPPLVTWTLMAQATWPWAMYFNVTAMAVQNYFENPELTTVLKHKPG